ncbi:MAG: acetyl-CoA carboxylase biotin carboxyl carrier protein [Fidelibacterota bacterium]
MWREKLKQLIELLEASNVHEIEVRFWGRRFRVSKGPKTEGNPQPSPPASGQQVEEHGHPGRKEAESPLAEPENGTADGIEIRAPMVGTFYRAASPDAPPFASEGDHVTAGQTLCIIEAMKIMNEIESEVTGRVAKILAENAQPVEYGHPLFVIEPD